MKWALAAAVGLAAAALFAPAQTSAINGQPTFRARTAGVRVDVLVTRSGRPVRGLTVDDFVLLDNGVPQVLKSADLEEVPLHTILALDTSESLSGSRLPSLVRASQALLDELKDTDGVTLLTFHRRLDLLAYQSRDRVALPAALARLRSGGATSLRDATYAGLTLPTSAIERALLLVFTDGRDAGSWLSEAAVLDAARVSSAVAYGVVIPDDDSSIEFLEQVVDLTGGRLLRVNRNDLRSSFQEVLAEFRARYLLTYAPSDVTPGLHSIEVRLRSGRGEVRARRGYISR
jgi:VWFA-related protein